MFIIRKRFVLRVPPEVVIQVYKYINISNVRKWMNNGMASFSCSYFPYACMSYSVSRVMVFSGNGIVLWDFTGNRHLRMKYVIDSGHCRLKEWHIWLFVRMNRF